MSENRSSQGETTVTKRSGACQNRYLPPSLRLFRYGTIAFSRPPRAYLHPGEKYFNNAETGFFHSSGLICPLGSHSRPDFTSIYVYSARPTPAGFLDRPDQSA